MVSNEMTREKCFTTMVALDASLRADDYDVTNSSRYASV